MAFALSRMIGVEPQVLGVQDSRAPKAWQMWGTSVFAHREVGPRAFGYAPGLCRTLAEFSPDIVDAQGLWMYPSLVSLRHHRRFRNPHVVTPHGMLDPWTLQRSRRKKRLAARWFENEHLRRAACLRALTMDEARAFRAYGLSNPIAVVPNGVDPPQDSVQTAKRLRTILFLGRIDPKKGSSELLYAWQLLVANLSPADWRLQVTGWGNSDYVATMRRLATTLDLDTSVTFTGPLYGEEKALAFRTATGFILPSFSEGLPMAVLEAWSYGLPVLMTRECNLPEGFALGAAIEITTEPAELAHRLRDLMTMSEDERHAMGQAGRRLVEQRFTWDRVAAELQEVYTWVLGGGPPPSCMITD